MRLLSTAVFNLFALLFGLLAAPLRLLDRKPRWLAVEVSGELPWREGRRHRWSFLQRSRRRSLAMPSLHALAKRLSKASQDPRVRARIQQAVDALNAKQASYSTIKKFAILPRDFTQEAGELTPTLKVKRKFCTEKYREILDSFYVE